MKPAKKKVRKVKEIKHENWCRMFHPYFPMCTCGAVERRGPR